MRDLPPAGELAELARRLLLDELTPLLPEERRRDAHLVATVLAMLRREQAAGDGPACEVAALLHAFYREGDASLARLAADLRRGEFETSLSRERAARAILWRLTILKLREANPQFLAAHGIV